MRTDKRVKSLTERKAEIRARHPYFGGKKSGSTPPPAKILTDKDISLGFDDAKQPVMIGTIDRCKHMDVIGTTGSGKSAFCVYCILQDIARGRGVCVLDPHGGHPDSVFNQVLASLRNNGWFDTGKVHIVAPNSPEYVVGFNPLAPVGKKDPSVIADAMLEAFQRVWGNENADTKPLMHRILLATFIALSEAHLPLAEASNLLDYEDRSGLRRKLIASTKNPVARNGLEYIQRLAEKRDSSEFNQTVMGPENRLVKFLASDAIRLMFSTTRDRGDRTLDFLEIMDRGDIILVDLQRGDAISGPNCKLLGAIIVRYLFELMASRKELPLPKGERYHPFMVYIDEAHEYLSGDVQKLLTEARKYRLGLTLAHQFVYQLEEAGEAIYHAVQSCTHSKVVFTIQSAQEAQDLAQDVLPLSLQEPVQASIRPTQLGSVIGKLKNETHGTQESVAETRARHRARSIGESITDTHQRLRGNARGTSVMGGSGSATISGSGLNSGTVAADSSISSISYGYDPNNPGTVMPMPLSMNMGSADGASHSHIASESSQRSKSLNAFEGQSASESTSEAESSGGAYSMSHARMDGDTCGTSVNHGTSRSQGVSEALHPIYEKLASSFHSKDNELYFKGEQIRNLPVGRAIARIGKTTTFLNVPPPRKSDTKPGDASPTALAALIAKTSAAQPREQIIQRHKTRMQERMQATAKPTPDEEGLVKREPMSMIDDPEFLAGFVKRFKAREQENQKPPKRSKPRIVVDNDKPGPADKK